MKTTKSKSSTKSCTAKFHVGPKTLNVDQFTDAAKYEDGKYPWCKTCSAKYTADRKSRLAAVAEGKSFTSKLTGRKYDAKGAAVKTAKPAAKAKASGKKSTKSDPETERLTTADAVKKALKKSGVKVVKEVPSGTVARMVAATE